MTYRKVNKYGLPMIPGSLILASGPVNPGRQVVRSTGEQVWITHNPCQPVNQG